MRRHGCLRVTLMVLGAACVLVGCTRDPNVRKQRYYESGNRFLQNKQYREASIQFQNAIQIDPRYADAHYQLAQCFLNMTDWPGAYRELLRAVELAPDNLKARIDLGNLYLSGREYLQAREQADLVLEKAPRNLDAHILRANSYAALQNLSASIHEMQTAVQLDPKQSTTYLTLGALQLTAQQYADAEASYKKAVELDPESVPAALALGSFYGQQRRWAEAETEYRRAIGIDPKSILAFKALALLFVAQDKKPQAEQVLQSAKQNLKDNPDGYRMLADFYWVTGDLDKSVAEFSSLLREHPKDLGIKKSYIQTLIFKGRLDEATELNDGILKSNPKSADGLIQRGEILIQRQHASDAIPPLQAALKDEPDNAIGHFVLGQAFSAVGDDGRAELEWRECARLQPNLLASQRQLAAVAIRKGDMNSLSEIADKVMTADRFSPDGYLMRAAVKLSRHDTPGAEADLKKAIDIAPQSAIGYTRFGQFRSSQKNYPEAEKLYEQALTRDPSSMEAMQGLVDALVQQKKSARALDRVNEQIAKFPGNSSLYILQSGLLVNLKQMDQAEAALNKAAELDPKNPYPIAVLAQLQTVRGNLDQAAASYQRAIQQSPGDARAYFLLGVLEDNRGNWQRAQDLYQQALQHHSDFPMAANNLAFILLEHGGNTDIALSLAQTARQKSPGEPWAADTLAWAYYHKGIYGLAVDLLEEACKKAPQNASYQYHLGMSYAALNDRSQARMHLQRVLELNPGYSHAEEVRKTLGELKTGK